MTNDGAIERIRKLREITVERGATEHEAAVASALAARLGARYGCSRPAADQRAELARYATSAASDRRSSRSLRFVAFA